MTYEEYNKVSAEITAKAMCFYNDKLVNVSKETQFSLLQNNIMMKGIENLVNKGNMQQ